MRQKKRWMALGLAAMMTTTAAPMPTMAEMEILSSGSETAETVTETTAETVDEDAAETLGDGEIEAPSADTASEALLEPSTEPVSEELASAEELETPAVGENEDDDEEIQAATSGKCGENVTWELSPEGVLTIKGSGPMYDRAIAKRYDVEEHRVATFYYQDASGETVNVPEAGWDSWAVRQVVIEEGVTNVGEDMFFDAWYVSKVTLADSVTEIQERAFESCDDLEEIVIPAGVTSLQESVFAFCDSLHTVKLPDTLESIGYGAFMGCNDLANIELPESLVEIDTYAFDDCYDLENIRLPEHLIEIGRYAFRLTGLREVVIPDSVKVVQENAFYRCTNLEKVTIGSGLLKLHEGVFEDCRSLKTVIFKGAAPIILDQQFEQESKEDISEITIVYPRYDESWTSEVMSRDYGAPVKWELAPLTELRAPVLKLSNTNQGIQVNWEAVKYAESYEISRKMENGEFVKVATVGADTLSYRDQDVLNGKAYTYSITAHSGEIASEAGQQKLMFLNNPGTTLANTNKGVKVSWNRVPSAKGYEVYRKLSTDKTYTKIATIKKGSTTSYLDAGTKSGKVYVYAVKAFYNSKHKSAHTRQSIRSLQTPTITKAVRGKTGVSLRWTAVSGAKGYYVYRKAGNGKYVRIATRDKVGAVTFKDTKAKAGQTYTYAVRAFSGKSMSAFIGKTVK